MKTAAWVQNLSYPVTSIEDWAQLVDRQAARAKAEGARILLLPEYASLHWLHFFPKGQKGMEEIDMMCDCGDAVVPLMSDIARRHDLLLVSGSFPVRRPELSPPYTNRSYVHFPDGRVLTHDKLCLTKFEKDPTAWNISPGDGLNIFEFDGYRMAVLICLDIELPELSGRLAGLGLDLLLVPSMTLRLAGYHRVFDCAKARAVELMAAVAVTGVVGGAPDCDQFISGAAFYLPCEEALGSTGTLASIPPSPVIEGEGPLLVRDLPLDEIRRLRAAAAEVWPGAWSADHVKIKEN